MRDEEIRDYHDDNGYPPHIVAGGADGLIRRWQEFVTEVEAGYRYGLEDYRNDLDLRGVIELVGLGENTEVERADTIRENVPNVAGLRSLFSHVGGSRVTASTARRAQAAQGTVGTQKQFKILTSNIGNSGGCAGGGTSGTFVCNVTITATLEAVGADLIVTGAYGYSRMREWFFGGVTRDLLAGASVCCLMSH